MSKGLLRPERALLRLDYDFHEDDQEAADVAQPLDDVEAWPDKIRPPLPQT